MTTRGQRSAADVAGNRQACAPVAKRRPSDGRGSRRERLADLALAALLSEPTMQQAATKAGISESTMLRWLADPSFQARYRAARRAVVETAVAQLQQGTSEAVETLRRNLKCGLPAAEIAAAKAVMDYSVKAIELVDLAERVEALERAATAAAEEEQR